MENLIIESWTMDEFEENTVSINVFNKKKNKFEDSIKKQFKTLDAAKSYFKNFTGFLIKEKGFKKVESFVNGDTYLELENDIYHVQMTIYY